MPHAELGAQRLYYEIHGDGERLLCVMGLGGDVSGWRLQLPAFSARYRTIVFDNRDVGRSSYAQRSYEIADLADDALALADALGLERFHLLGISMGGAIAQEMALSRPERISTLTLCVSYASAGRWARERARLQVEASGRTSDERLIDEMMLMTLSEASYEHAAQIALVRRIMLSYRYRQRREGFIRHLQASVRHDARDRLPALSMPVHVIGAEQDLLVPVWKARELADLIPAARLSIVSAAAHAVNVERAAEFNALVLDFLQADRR